jgi:hypothetical protein
MHAHADEWLKDLDHNEIKHTAKIEHKKRERRDRFPRHPPPNPLQTSQVPRAMVFSDL